LRCLLIEDDPDYRRLLRQHVVTAAHDAEVVEYVPAESGRFAPEFTAAGFDVVVLDSRPAGEDGLAWLADLRARPLFPPVLYVLRDAGPEADAAARDAGAIGTVARPKIDPRRLGALLQEAEQQRRTALQAWRATPAAADAYRFGNIVIRGERCIRPLAASAMSTVYLAESEREGRLVCLKVLRQVPDNTDKVATFDRFLQEYEIIAKIRHPNVVQIHDLGISDDHAYIAMEYFPAGDLRTRMKRGFAPAEAVRVLRQMAEALGAIHRVGVLHRDLKPGNVMLRRDGTIALIDFGLAKQLALDAEITATGEIFGTPYYMSPEQGHGRDVDERSDLYSLGVIFWEMVTGRKPFLAPTPMAVIYKHSHAPIPELPPELQPIYGPLVARLLAKEPRDRFQSAFDLLHALDELPAGSTG
jgi:DNA-binding response OmpR family regulator